MPSEPEFSVPTSLCQSISQLVEDLAAGNYELLESDRRAGRLTAEELRMAVEGYGRKLISLPKGWQQHAEAYPWDECLGSWSVDVDLWTLEEGLSDLTLQVDAKQTPDGITVQIQDLRVL